MKHPVSFVSVPSLIHSSPCVFYDYLFQEVSTLLLAASVMGDSMSLLNWLGFAVCLCGISLHVGLKALNSKREFRFC